MVELLRYLEANGFTNYIVVRRRPRLHAAGHRAAVRDPARAGGRQFGGSGLPRRRTATTTDQPEFLDDGPIKPVRLWSRIGRRPILAAGNSNGDIEMLEFTRGTLRLLVLHDDADREFDYTAGAEKALEQAAKDGWTVVSMKNDWATVFSATNDDIVWIACRPPVDLAGACATRDGLRAHYPEEGPARPVTSTGSGSRPIR